MSQDEMRQKLHRLVDQLPDERLPTALHRLADDKPVVDASQTRGALESLYSAVIPDDELDHARACLSQHRRAS